MTRTITSLVIAGALALGSAGCTEENESEWEGAGEEVGEALEDTGERAERGAETAAGETREAIRDLDDDGHTDHEHEVERTN